MHTKWRCCFGINGAFGCLHFLCWKKMMLWKGLEDTEKEIHTPLWSFFPPRPNALKPNIKVLFENPPKSQNRASRVCDKGKQFSHLSLNQFCFFLFFYQKDFLRIISLVVDFNKYNFNTILYTSLRTFSPSNVGSSLLFLSNREIYRNKIYHYTKSFISPSE